MAAFHMNEASFDLPDAGFVDHTVTYLVGKSPRGTGCLLCVERRPLPAGKTLRQAAAGLAADIAVQLRGYRALFERDVEVAGKPAIDVGARWRGEDGEPMYTRRVHLVRGTTWLAVCAEGPVEDSAFCDAYLAHALATLRFHA
jgi:hypothetical protein